MKRIDNRTVGIELVLVFTIRAVLAELDKQAPESGSLSARLASVLEERLKIMLADSPDDPNIAAVVATARELAGDIFTPAGERISGAR